MKFILKRTTQWRDTDKHLLEEYNDFYYRETIETKISGNGSIYHVHFINILSLEELLSFISSLGCGSTIISEDMWNHKKYYTIEIYDGYRE